MKKKAAARDADMASQKEMFPDEGICGDVFGVSLVHSGLWLLLLFGSAVLALQVSALMHLLTSIDSLEKRVEQLESHREPED